MAIRPGGNLSSQIRDIRPSLNKAKWHLNEFIEGHLGLFLVTRFGMFRKRRFAGSCCKTERTRATYEKMWTVLARGRHAQQSENRSSRPQVSVKCCRATYEKIWSVQARGEYALPFENRSSRPHVSVKRFGCSSKSGCLADSPPQSLLCHF